MRIKIRYPKTVAVMIFFFFRPDGFKFDKFVSRVLF